MVRAPCCAKMGLNRGPWTLEEDQILTSYIQKYGHSNWRALPKLAGLLRCGKSCRLRWINYLNPEIKRGNFSREEEDAIIDLHELLGNKWSAIAAKLPGRTDNEIKNVWHTHLKKRLLKQKKNQGGGNYSPQQFSSVQECSVSATANTSETESTESQSDAALSHQPSSSGSGAVFSVSSDNLIAATASNYVEILPEEEEFPVLIDEAFWSAPEEEESGEYLQFDPQINPLDFSVLNPDEGMNGGGGFPRIDEGMDFWYDLFVQAGGIEGL
ncbi:unnamed protein product [Linum tenue]|uniref:Uncharacterized protein n=1 Tax=Linum tenue TaxID=586396 RepID=A0AAV0RNP0_9ROSI|nr:unnamed protein product [Linum tenue]